MPSTTSSIGLGGLRFLDRDHAFAADLFHGVGDEFADRRVVVGRDGGDLRLLLAGRDRARHLAQRRDGGLGAAVETALDVDRAGARRDIADAVGKDRVRQDRRGAGAVADDVAGLSAAWRSICAPRFSSGSLRSNSLAIVTPSLQTIGAPHFFWISTDFDFGPSVTRTASASCVAPRRIFSRAAERNRTCLCAMGWEPVARFPDFILRR